MTPLSDAVNPYTTFKTPTQFLSMLHQKNYHHLGRKETEGEIEERLLNFQNPIGCTQADENTQLKHILSSRKKG
jgi:hypothetical protein